ncbi:hypothetical protein U1Q18_036646 [Sarracenia purpurea var. burkii]
MRKHDNLAGLSPTGGSEISGSGSPTSYSKPLKNRVVFSDSQDIKRKSISRRGDEPPVVDSFPERTQAGDLLSPTVGGRRLPW